MDNSVLITTDIECCRLGLDHAGNILCDRTLLGRGHQTLGTQDTRQPRDGGVHTGCRDTLVELVLALLHLLDQLGTSDNVGARGARLLGELALGKDQDDRLLLDGLLEQDRGADGLRVLLGLGVGLDVDLDQVVGLGDLLGLIKSWVCSKDWRFRFSIPVPQISIFFCS